MKCPFVSARKLGKDGLVGAAVKKEGRCGRAVNGVRTTLTRRKGTDKTKAIVLTTCSYVEQNFQDQCKQVQRDRVEKRTLLPLGFAC